MSKIDVATLVPVRQLGRGTLCEVILVEDPSGRRFALKRALAEHRQNPGVIRLLEEEARVAAQLVHPAIPRLHARSDTGDGLVMIFELLDGVTLDELLPKKQALSIPAAHFVVDQVLGALAYVHALPAAVVHRDVGPHNIVITRPGDPALIDFGIASDDDRDRWTAAGAVRGTLGYVAPETVRGEPIDARADLFAVAALLYRLITGVTAFRGRGPRQILDAVSRAAFVPVVDVDPGLARFDPFFTKGMAAVPSARFADASSMRSALGKLERLDPTRSRAELAALVAPHVTTSESRGPTLS